MARHPLFAAVIVAILHALPAPAQLADLDFPIANGRVYAVAYADNYLYLGGDFSSVGPPTGCLVPVTSASGLPVAGHERFDGFLRSMIPDGEGGWFLSGSISAPGVAGTTGVIHQFADGTFAPYTPHTSGHVYAMALHDGVLYVGGSFGGFNGASRMYLAAMDATTGETLPWNPGADDKVETMVVVDGILYVGGSFTTCGGQTRRRLAAFDTATGELTSWNPNVTYPDWRGEVASMVPVGGTLYIGGTFTAAGGRSRTNLAAVSLATGAATAWNPYSSGWIRELALDGTTLYVGGGFTWVGGRYCNRLAALDLATGQALSWDPGIDDDAYDVRAIARVGDTVYFGGIFTSVQGEDRRNAAAVDAATGALRPWDPHADMRVSSLVPVGGAITMGGEFRSLGGETRHNAAAIHVPTGTVAAWNPDVDDEVHALAVDGVTVYAGGLFGQVGGAPRDRVAALNVWDGAVRPWNPGVDGEVRSIAVSGNAVYLGGGFSQVAGQARSRLAAVDKASGAALAWNPGADGTVHDILPAGDVVYVAGAFGTVGGQPRGGVAALDAGTAAVRLWNPAADAAVRTLGLIGGLVYAGGEFSAIGGQPRSGIAALDAGTGLATGWDPGVSGTVNTLAISAGVVYAAGQFGEAGGRDQGPLVALDMSTGQATDWSPTLGGQVYDIALGAGSLFVGGGFYGIEGEQNNWFLASYAADDVPPAWPPEWDRHVTVHVQEADASEVVQVAFRGSLPFGAKAAPAAPYPVSLVDGFATMDSENLAEYFLLYGSDIDRIDLLAYDGSLVGHIPFHYDQGDYGDNRGVDAFLYVHNDEAAMTPANEDLWRFKDQLGWEYYEEGEYPVSMLIPPTMEAFGLGDATKEPVVFLHGINAGFDGCWQTLPELVDPDVYDCWRFAYPHDQPIDSSARLLGLAVERVLTGGIPGHYGYAADRVALVAHSMGGLVSRTYIQGGEYAQRGEVSKLLMFGTPNHGSYSSYRAFHDRDLLSGAGDAFGLADRGAPAHAMMTPGSLFLTTLNAFPPRGLGTGDPARDYLVVAGVRDYMANDLPHREIFRQDDGFVAAASASLLEHDVPLALTYRHHLEIKLQDDDYDAARIVETFLNPGYDPAGGTPAFPDEVFCFLPDTDNRDCSGEHFTDDELGILEFRILNVSDDVDRYRITLPESEPGVMDLTANAGDDWGQGNRFLQRIGDSDGFFSLTQRLVLQKEIGFWGPEGAYDLRVRHGGVHMGTFPDATEFQWLATSSATIALSPVSCVAIAAPNQSRLTPFKAAPVGYAYTVDATVDTLVFNLSSETSPADFSQHGFQLVEPGGRIIDPAVAAADPALDFFANADHGPAQYMIVDPTDGVWQLQHDDSVPAAAVHAYVYAGFRASLAVDGSAHAADDTLACHVQLSGAEGCTSRDLVLHAALTPAGGSVPLDLGAVPLVDAGGDRYEASLTGLASGQVRLTLDVTCQDAVLGTLARTAVRDVWIDRAAGDVSAVRGDEDAPPPAAAAGRPLSIRSVAPNPFNPRTTVVFTLGRSMTVDAAVYDVSGRLVRRLAGGVHEAGEHRLVWDGRDGRGRSVAAGVYFVRLEVPGEVRTRKVALVK